MRVFRLFGHCVLLFSLAFVSCERFEDRISSFQTDWIRFSAGEGIEASGAVETKSLENEISCEISEWEYSCESEKSGTKASILDTIPGEVGVFGYNYKEWGSSVKPNVMHNLKSTVKGSDITPQTMVLWKDCTLDSVRFYAYAPYGKFASLSQNSEGGYLI